MESLQIKNLSNITTNFNPIYFQFELQLHREKRQVNAQKRVQKE